MSDSAQSHRQQPTRLPCPWDSPGKNTEMVCHFLLQCMKGKRESEVPQSCPTLSDPMDCSLPGSSVHRIFQARILEWVASAFSICPSQYIIYWNKIWHCILLLVMLTLITWLNGVCGSSLFNVNIFPFTINKYFVKKYFKLYKYPIYHQSLILASTDGVNNM